MKTHSLHSWSLSTENARAIQRHLSAWVITEGICEKPRLIGRIEIGATKESKQSATAQASISILSNPSQTLLERKVAIKTSVFPSRAGLHAFRKVPAVIAALNKLNRVPDLFICDGRGKTGLDSFGVASHIGLITNVPTIGIRPVKPKQISRDLAALRGNWVPTKEPGTNAALLRVVDGEDPILVSPAHKIGLQSAIDQVLGYLPESISAREYQQFLYPETRPEPISPAQSQKESHLALVKTATGQ